MHKEMFKAWEGEWPEGEDVVGCVGERSGDE